MITRQKTSMFGGVQAEMGSSGNWKTKRVLKNKSVGEIDARLLAVLVSIKRLSKSRLRRLISQRTAL